MKRLDPEDPAIPCGSTAKSFFNDTFKLHKKIGEDYEEIEIDDKTNIAWESD